MRESPPLRRILFLPTLCAASFALVDCGGEPPTELPPPDDSVANVSVSAASGVPLEDGQPTIEVGQTARFDASARNDRGGTVTTTFTWSSLDAAVATVDGSGTATARSPGQAGIVARAANGVSDTATLVVVDSIGPVAAVAVRPQRDTVFVGESADFEASATDADGDSVAIPFVWISLDTAVASVDTAGTATGRQRGTARIVAEVENGTRDTARLVVRDTAAGENQPPEVAILEPSNGATFSRGDTIRFRAEASDPEEGSLPPDSLVWKSSRDGELGTGEEIEAVLSTGTHTISFTATDSEGASAADTVTVEVASAPNLRASALDLLPRGVLESATASAHGVVVNTEADAGSYAWELREDGTVLASGTRSGVAGGTADTVPMSGLGPFTTGTHHLTFVVDPGDEVDETDEGDNTATARLESYPSGFKIELQFVGAVPSQFRDEVRTERDRWARVVTGDLEDVDPDSLSLNECFSSNPGLGPRDAVIDDVLLLVQTDSIDGPGSTLAQAGPCYIRSDPSDPELPPLPVVGVATFDTADVASMRAQGILDDVILHEMAHVLGFGGLWTVQGGRDDHVGPFQLVSGEGTSDPRFNGPVAIREYGDVGGSGSTVPLESGGGSGTASVHWREAVFDEEVMTGFVNTGPDREAPLSVVTIGSLGDMFYAVDLGEADPFSLDGGSALRASGAASGSAVRIGENLLAPRFAIDPATGRVWRLDGEHGLPHPK